MFFSVLRHRYGRKLNAEPIRDKLTNCRQFIVVPALTALQPTMVRLAKGGLG